MATRSKEKNREYQKVWYAKNKNIQYTRVKKRQLELREWYKKYKASLKCEICGEKHPATIDFHHKDPKKKEIEVYKMCSSGFGMEKILEEIKKCQVLCSNCHRKKHWNGL